MENRLLQAALEGNVESLNQLLTENSLVLDRVTVGCSNETPLHVAVLFGHVEFVKEVLRRNPELAEVLDSHKSSPLHLASAKGYVEIVRELVLARPGMCTVLDRDGFNPLHLAAMKGKVDVLRELVRAMPQAARARVDRGETILHLCVKFCQIEALNLLLKIMDDGLKNAKDNNGNTILHLAVADKEIKIVKYLLTNGMDVNATNANGYTALDILAQSPRDVQDYDIQNFLEEAGGLKVVEHDQTIPFPATKSNPQMPSFLHDHTTSLATQGDKLQSILNNGDWLVKKRDKLMVVASVLATMAFRAGVSPPGGVWKEDSVADNPNPYRAGEAVVAYNYPGTYKFFLSTNTIGFLASLSTIFLLISGLPFKHRIYMWILRVIMWLSITSMAFTYAFSIVAVTQIQDRGPIRRTMYVAIPIWCGVMALLLLRQTIHLVVNKIREKRSGQKAIEKCFKFASDRPHKREPIAPPNLVNTNQADVCFSCSRCEFH